MIRKLNCGLLVLTYNCNNRCKWCYASPAGFTAEEMAIGRARQFIKLMRSLGIRDIGLIGGEPTLYSKLSGLIAFAKKQGLDVTLYSNGKQLSREPFVKKIKAAGTDFVNISIQSIDPKTHDEQSGVKGAFEETISGIENCFSQDLTVNLETVVSHTNFGAYKELVDSFQNANRFIFFREAPPVNNPKAKCLSNWETRKIFRKIFSYAHKKKARVYFFARMPYCWFEQDALDKEIRPKIVSHCHILSGKTLAVDVDGKALPCPQWIAMPSMNLIENNKVISKKQFLGEWNNGKPAAVREALTKYPAKECAECMHWGKECTGGCPLVKFELPPAAIKARSKED
jgi:radical SAM protein with 4Fe4S-binding SPASM domain